MRNDDLLTMIVMWACVVAVVAVALYVAVDYAADTLGSIQAVTDNE